MNLTPANITDSTGVSQKFHGKIEAVIKSSKQ
jgi:hypothetical protein